MQSIIITKIKNKNKINKSNYKTNYFDIRFDKINDIGIINIKFSINNIIRFSNNLF